MKYYNDIKAALKQTKENIMVNVIGTVISADGVYHSIKAKMTPEQAVRMIDEDLLAEEVFFIKGKNYGFFWDAMPEELSWGA